MDKLKKFWDKVIDELAKDIGELHLNTWIRPIKPILFLNNTIYIDAKVEFIEDMIKERYLKTISKIASNILNRKINIILTNPNKDDYEKILNLKSDDLDLDKGNDTNNTSINNLDILEEDRNSDSPNLNPRYTFDSFVSGKSNEFALSAAIQVSNNPGRVYNPLFIYGGSGLGKTHLMQAIAHEIIRKDKLRSLPSNVLYISSEDFTNEIIRMIAMKNLREKEIFRRKYRMLDVLLIDDIQFLANKDATIEEFFHIFNALKENNKQIVISADKHPKDLRNIEERLITRFEGGLSVDIQVPDFETRVAIIHRKLQMDKTSLPQSIIELIAQGETTSIRALEGDLLKVQAIANTKNIDFNSIDENTGLLLAERVLDLEEKREKKITLKEIFLVIEGEYGVSIDDLKSKKRQSQITHPRQIAMYLSRELTDLSLVKIGEAFNRDHTTVMHSIDKIESEIKEKVLFKNEIDKIIKRIKS